MKTFKVRFNPQSKRTLSSVRSTNERLLKRTTNIKTKYSFSSKELMYKAIPPINLLLEGAGDSPEAVGGV